MLLEATIPAEIQTLVSVGEGILLFVITEASGSSSDVKSSLLNHEEESQNQLLSGFWLRRDFHKQTRRLTPATRREVLTHRFEFPENKRARPESAWGERSDKNQSKSRESLDIWSVFNYPWLNCADVGPQWKQLCLTSPARLNEAKSPKQLNTVFRFLLV